MAKSYEEPLATAKELAKRIDISPFVRMAMIFQACRNSSAAFLKIQSDAGNGVQENAFLHNKYINYLITELKPVTGEIIRQGAAEGLIVCQQPDALADCAPCARRKARQYTDSVHKRRDRTDYL